jgi:dienelactone hydrolase
MQMNTTDGIVEHNLEVTSNGHRVPAVLWLPVEAEPPLPLVLVGHGGGGHKKAAPVVSMAQGLIQEHGIAALAIDGPVNGDRDANSESARQIRQQDRHEYRRLYYQEKYDEMVQDWRDALTAAQSRPEVGSGPVGYWGLSMGTRFGVPLIAAEPRIQAAVIGLFGYREGSPVNQRVYDDIGKVRIPVLFLQQLDDDEVSQDAYWALFRRIGTADKRLHANPGKHAAVPQSEREASRLFLARKLKARRHD